MWEGIVKSSLVSLNLTSFPTRPQNQLGLSLGENCLLFVTWLSFSSSLSASHSFFEIIETHLEGCIQLTKRLKGCTQENEVGLHDLIAQVAGQIISCGTSIHLLVALKAGLEYGNTGWQLDVETETYCSIPKCLCYLIEMSYSSSNVFISLFHVFPG